MRALIILIFSIPWIISAQTEPRLQQVSRTLRLPLDVKPLVLDLDGDSLNDIIYLQSAGQNPGRGAIIRNLGDRSFAAPTFGMYAESAVGIFDAEASLVKINGPTDYHFSFVQYITKVSGDPSYNPVIVGLDKPRAFGRRISISPVINSYWSPINLDGDGSTEFYGLGPEANGQSEFRIWDRQPNASYVSQSFMLDGLHDGIKPSAIDLDNDGDLDLVFSEDLYAIERTGLRTFSSVPRLLSSLAQLRNFADLNGDGLPDAYRFENGRLEWRLNSGNFAFGAPQSNTFASVNGEGVKLISIESQPSLPAVINLGEKQDAQVKLDRLRFGTWEIIHQSTIALDEAIPSGNSLSEINFLTVSDFDQDGHQDLSLSYLVSYRNIFGADFSRLAIAWGSPSGFSSAEPIHPAPISFRKVLVKDFDRDGDPDLIHGPDTNGYFWFFSNSGNGSFPNPVRLDEIYPPAIAPFGTRIGGFKAADLNGDSILDLAIDYTAQAGSGFFAQSWGVALGLGNGRFSTVTLPPGAFDFVTTAVTGIDFLSDWDRDGDLDAISAGAWRENLGGMFSQESRFLAESDMTDVLGNPINALVSAVGDLDGDGAPEMLALNYRSVSPPPSSAAGTPMTFITGILFNDGLGGIESIAELSTNGIAFDALGNFVLGRVAIVDMNSDGRKDLVIEEFGMSDALGNPTRKIRWLRNPGGGSRNPAAWVSLPLGSRIMPSDVLLDFDGDQRLEWVSPTGYVRPSNRGPVVSPVYRFTGGVGFPDSFNHYPADFDGDGDTDFLMANSMDEATLLINPIVDERSAITHYLVAAQAKPSLAGPNQDADGDGRDNQTELIYGTNPLLVDIAPVNPLAVGLDESLTFRTPQYAASLNLNYQVQKSTNLIDWEDFSILQNAPRHSAGGWNYFSTSIQKAEPGGFFRIKGWHRID